MVMALDGIKVLDLSRLAPGPYCSMLLADFGADVTLVEAVPGSSAKLGSGPRRADSAQRAAAYNALGRGKRSIALNLKDEAAREIFYRMCESADVVLEGFRPGVVKRLGVDYETLAARNPRIVYCSLSGFGQTGPYSNLVGHDINYIAIGGALGVIGLEPGGKPAIPINVVADFAGGGLMAAFAISVALLARERTGRGQNVDIGMSDGVLSLLTSAFTGFFNTGQPIRPGAYLLNGAAPFYGTYRCADDRWFSLGSIESHFFEALCKVLGTEEYLGRQFEETSWPEQKERIASIMRTKTADEWFTIMSQYDICAAPVLEMENVVTDPHNIARGMVIEVDSPVGKVRQIGVGPKLSDTPGKPRGSAPMIGEHTDTILGELGLSESEVATLRASGAAG